MEYEWNMDGAVKHMYGMGMEKIWNWYGICVEYVRNMSGILMGYV